MKYEIKQTTKFKKDFKLIVKQGKNVNKVFDIIEKLANDVPLDEKNRDHALTGDYVGFRECHVEPDLLLVYKKSQDVLILYLARIGSHADLF